MKAILEFNLPEENEDHDLALNGYKYKIIVDEIDNYLRSKLKYEDLSDVEHDIYQKVRDELARISDEYK